MIALSLADIAAAMNGTLHLVDPSVPDTLTAESLVGGAVHTDSREVTAGDIFVAKPGEETDGHLFAPAAVAGGAAVLIVERVLELPVAQVLVPDAVLALGDLATDVIARVRAAGRLQVIGITRSEERRVGKECSAVCRSRWSPYH